MSSEGPERGYGLRADLMADIPGPRKAHDLTTDHAHNWIDHAHILKADAHPFRHPTQSHTYPTTCVIHCKKNIYIHHKNKLNVQKERRKTFFGSYIIYLYAEKKLNKYIYIETVLQRFC